ncbi:hypothetical protein ACFV23_04910 [Streptomyces sp. NPDC059627]
MPARLLDSRYEILDPLEADEPGVTIDASGDREQVLATALRAVTEAHRWFAARVTPPHPSCRRAAARRR